MLEILDNKVALGTATLDIILCAIRIILVQIWIGKF